MDILVFAAAVAGVLSFLWIVFFGQKSFREWLHDRKQEKIDPVNPGVETSPNSSSLPTIPHNLPPRVDFVGREQEKQQVHEALKSRSYIVMIDGIGGIGKTSLALEVLHECLGISQNSHPAAKDVPKFNAFIWTSARDRELNLNDVLDTIARTIDYPFITQLSPEEKRHEVAKRLQQQPCLLIVDNFETVVDEELHQFVLSLPEPSKCLITSRVQSLRQARAVSIRGMAQEEALLLIKNEGIRLGLNLETLTENEDNFRRFYESTGGAPLAIRWAIGQSKQRGQSIDGVLNSLHGAHGDIFEFIFQRAWSLLSERAKKVLTIMPVFAASASKAAIEAASLDEALGQLVELWLLEASEQLDEVKRRYQLHFYAYSKLSQTFEVERQARVQLAEFFESFAKERQGDKWAWKRYDEIEEEKNNIFEVAGWCFENGEGDIGMELTRSVTFFMGLRGYHHEGKVLGHKAVEVARQKGETIKLAWLLTHGIGWIETVGRNLERSEALIAEGLKIYETHNDSRGIISALRTLGLVLRFKSDFEGARHCYERSIRLAESLQDELEVAHGKRFLSLLIALEGSLQEAKKMIESVLSITKEQDKLLRASALGDLAFINYKLEEYDIALKIGIEALQLAKRLKKRYTIAWISFSLAKIETARKNYLSAFSYAKQALEFYERLGIDPERLSKTKTLITQLQEKLTHSRKEKNQ